MAIVTIVSGLIAVGLTLLLNLQKYVIIILRPWPVPFSSYWRGCWCSVRCP